MENADSKTAAVVTLPEKNIKKWDKVFTSRKFNVDLNEHQTRFIS